MPPTFLAALPILLAGAPGPVQDLPQAAPRGVAGPFSWSAPDALAPIARPITATAPAELARIEAWLGLPPAGEGAIEWHADRAAFSRSLGGDAPSWFAGVTVPSQRRILMLADRGKAPAQLAETFRHELVHWAMTALGDRAWRALPAWLHEGIAETWARTDPLSQFSSPLAWRAFRGELEPLARFRDGFDQDPVSAAEGYALGYAFVRRLVREHGEDFPARLLARVRAGDTLDQALIELTGLSVVSHEQALRDELGSLSALLGEIYPQLFLLMALFSLASAPFVIRARRRRRRRFEAKWEAEERENLAEEGQEEDDRWIQPR